MSETVSVAAVQEHRDYTGAKIGMWLFLFTEVVLFGGMFLLYAVYRSTHPKDFHEAAKTLNVATGTFNTLILLTSSFTVVLSLAAIRKGNKALSLFLLAATIVFGMWFMENKYFEWNEKIEHGLYPGSPEMMSRSKGEALFYGLYYTMTGLHAVHILVGVVILAVMFFIILRKPFHKQHWDIFRQENLKGCHLAICDLEGKELWHGETVDDSFKRIYLEIQYYPTNERLCAEDFVALENSTLYWHLVDIIWIFLFPLFYLIS